jgi:hypothetical protein
MDGMEGDASSLHAAYSSVYCGYPLLFTSSWYGKLAWGE